MEENHSKLKTLVFAALMAVLVAPLATQSSHAGTSAPTSKEMESYATERFQQPDPTSREYSELGRPRARSYEFGVPPADGRVPVPAQKPETN
jgi:hypothetical protein